MANLTIEQEALLERVREKLAGDDSTATDLDLRDSVNELRKQVSKLNKQFDAGAFPHVRNLTFKKS